MNQIDKYIDYIRKELEMCEAGRKWGGVMFQLHFKDGVIGSIKVQLDKSVKLDTELDSQFTYKEFKKTVKGA